MREYGECGSTRAVKEILAAGGVSVAQLGECRGRRDALEAELEQGLVKATETLSVELAYLEYEREAREAAASVDLAKRRTKVDNRRAELLAAQRTASGGGNFVSRIVSFGRSIGLSAAYQAERRLVDAQALAVLRGLALGRQQVEALRASPEAWIERRTPQVRRSLAAVNAGLEDESFRGAIGEEMVAEGLRGLGDGFAVIHDVNIKLPTPIRLFDERFQAAQVDHVVVGPTASPPVRMPTPLAA